MRFTCAAGAPDSKHSFGESREKDWEETERRDGGLRRERSKRVRSSLRVTLSVPFH